jgi:3-oxoacyl-[acyl-carrier protein] reductase
LVIGGSRGAGKEIAKLLAIGGTETHVLSRGAEDLRAVQADVPGIQTIAQDATDAEIARSLMAELNPDLLVLTAGKTPLMAPPQQQSWEEFSAPWNVDVRIAHAFVSAALNQPMQRGGTVVSFSSGASLSGSRLSGGYAGAKRMQHFLTEYAQRESEDLGLGLRFLSIIPKQLVHDTEKGLAAATAYAEMSDKPLERFWKQWDSPLLSEDIARNVMKILGQPNQWQALAYTITSKGIAEL